MRSSGVLFVRPRARRAIHVPVLLSLSTLAFAGLAAASRGGGSFDGPVASLAVAVLASFTLSQFRMVRVEGAALVVTTLLGRRELGLEGATLGISASRSNHGLPLYVVHAEAGGARLTLSDGASRARAEADLRALRDALWGDEHAGPGEAAPSDHAPEAEPERGALGLRPLGGGRAWLVACAVGAALGALAAIAAIFDLG